MDRQCVGAREVLLRFALAPHVCEHFADVGEAHGGARVVVAEQVAPDDRREKVKREINRPTFFYLDQPLFTVCKFIPYSRLQEGVQQSQPYLGRLKYEFIDDLAEVCEASQPEVDVDV